jgi:hypothetical protein
MLPLGQLALGARATKFTPDEQRTLMTLWAIARSPLIMGGDLRRLDAPTLALLTNRAVLAVNQASRDNRPHFVADGTRIWSARPVDGGGVYVALFNTTAKPMEVGLPLAMLGLPATVTATDLWAGQTIGRASHRFTRPIPPHGAGLYRLQP